jgi:hypothetical protein
VSEISRKFYFYGKIYHRITLDFCQRLLVALNHQQAYDFSEKGREDETKTREKSIIRIDRHHLHSKPLKAIAREVSCENCTLIQIINSSFRESFSHLPKLRFEYCELSYQSSEKAEKAKENWKRPSRRIFPSIKLIKVEIYQFYCLSKPSGVFFRLIKKRERRKESKQETEIVRMKKKIVIKDARRKLTKIHLISDDAPRVIIKDRS